MAVDFSDATQMAATITARQASFNANWGSGLPMTVHATTRAAIKTALNNLRATSTSAPTTEDD